MLVADVARPTLIVYCGLPGVGKSTAAAYTADQCRASRYRSDEVRKELFDDPQYTEAEDDSTYEELLARARSDLRAGDDVVVDATFGSHRHRELAMRTADAADADSTFVRVTCEQSVVERRIRARTETVSDADVRIYRELRAAYDPFERDYIEVDNSGDLEDLHRSIDQRVLDWIEV